MRDPGNEVGPVSQYRMQESNMFMVNFIFCPSKTNTSRLKNTSLLVIEMSLNNAFNTGQITEVSDSTKRQ